MCPGSRNNIIIPLGSLDRVKSAILDNLDEDFKAVLNGLRMDDVGNYIKGDPIIIMIGARSFECLKKKKDKKKETKRSIRGRMRILGRLYLCFKEHYDKQSEFSLPVVLHNAGDIFHRDCMLILAKTINDICERKESEDASILSNDKNGLKIFILNTLKLAGRYLIGYYLMKRQDASADEVVNFH